MKGIRIMHTFAHAVTRLGCAGLTLAAIGCGSSDPVGSGGEGRLSFTTWGEAFIEEAIPPDPGDGSGFVDGWTVRYDQFLVNFQNIVVADALGETAAQMPGSMLFDNTQPGVKSIVTFDGVPARAWERISYEIAPVTEATELAPGVSEADRAAMLAGGYALVVSGSATRDDIEKRFAWGFGAGARYEECRSEQDGVDTPGVLVTGGASVEVELTTHGDHLFYDRLQASPDPSLATALRFENLAAADADADGEVTLAELEAQPLDVRLYNPSGLGATTYADFVRVLARTVGHFRGEGECTVRGL